MQQKIQLGVKVIFAGLIQSLLLEDLTHSCLMFAEEGDKSLLTVTPHTL